jgi:hypothetical protein
MVTLHNWSRFPSVLKQGLRPCPRAGSPNPYSVEWQPYALVVVKASYPLDGREATPAEPEEQVPIVEKDSRGSAGHVEGDLALEKGGVDLVALGSAIAPRAKPVREMDVSLSVGERAFRLHVTGDRSWKRTGPGSYLPTAPAPFTEMPITWARAFGGEIALEDGQKLVFAANPEGKGYCPEVAERDPEGIPLPNIEREGKALERPEETPDPVGFAFYPVLWSLRLLRGLELPPVPEGGWPPGGPSTLSPPPKPLPRLFNSAHPDLVLPEFPSGQVLRAVGMSANPVEVEIPTLDLCLEHAHGGHKHLTPLKVDTIVLDLAARKLVLCGRWLVPLDEAAVGGEEVFQILELAVG